MPSGRLKGSVFNVVVPDGDEFIVFNTRKGSAAILSKDELALLESCRGPSTDDFIGLGFLVDSELDETDGLLAERASRIGELASSEQCTFRIFSTTRCNARCGYCFEKGYAKDDMSCATALSTAEFVHSFADGGSIHIGWFGGEPLLNPSVIDSVHHRLEHLGDECTSSIITNGTLASEPSISDSFDFWNLKSAQVTLDGLEGTHDARKGVGPGSFLRALSGIDSLLDRGVGVTVRINFDQGNLREVPELIDLLHDRYRSRIQVYVAALYQAILPGPEDPYPPLIRSLWDHGYTSNYRNLVTQGRRIGCGLAYSPRSLVVSTDGRLFKCPETVHIPGTSVGDVLTGITDMEELGRWTDPSIPESCRDCRILPICQCGCRASERGLIGNPMCNRYRDSMDDIVRLVHGHHRV